MDLLFLTLVEINTISQRGIYTDLLRKFVKEGHNVTIMTPQERRKNINTHLRSDGCVSILQVKTLNITKTNIIEKGFGTLLIEWQYKRAIKKYLSNTKFDIVLYSTPPITLTSCVKYIRRRDNAKSYLLLKDIFPQNAVDLGMFSKNSLIYSYFRRKEKELYKVSDVIGCMSPANVSFLLKHNPTVSSKQVEVNPNSIELLHNITEIDKASVRKQYGLPLDKLIFIYGGNLGKPQGVDFLVNLLDVNENRNDCFILVVGKGTELVKLEKWFMMSRPINSKLIDGLPKNDYDLLVSSCDVGLIFLDKNFTIPNYPSRLLSYLENKMPILAATDLNTDIGIIAEQNGYGYWCESGDVKGFYKLVDKFTEQPEKILTMGENGYKYLNDNYTVDNSYDTIIRHF